MGKAERRWSLEDTEEVVGESELYLPIGGNLYQQEPFESVLQSVVEDSGEVGGLLCLIETDKALQEKAKKIGGGNWRKSEMVITAGMMVNYMTSQLGYQYVDRKLWDCDLNCLSIPLMVEEIMNEWLKRRSFLRSELFDDKVWQEMAGCAGNLLINMPVQCYGIFGAVNSRKIYKEIWNRMRGASFWPFYIYDVRHRNVGIYANDGEWVCMRNQPEEVKVFQYDWWLNWVLPMRMDRLANERYAGLEESLPFLQASLSVFSRGRKARNYWQALRELGLLEDG